MARTIKNENTGEIRAIAHGVRIDCVWELLAHHKLLDRVAMKIDTSKLNVERWLKPDERDELALRVERMADQANQQFVKEEFDAALEKIDEAIKLAPDYAKLQRIRGAVVYNFASKHWKELPRDKRIRLDEVALRDYKRAMQLDPSDPMATACVAQVGIALGDLAEDREMLLRSIEVAERLTTLPQITDRHRAFAQSNLGYGLRILGRFEEAAKAYDEAIRLMPGEPAYWTGRGLLWGIAGNKEREAADLAKAEEVRKRLAEEIGHKIKK
jgi:tetratricopeptide (TPR) repeat protein